MSSFPILDPQQVATATAQPGLVLLDFWQASCAPCRALEPRLAELATSTPARSTATASTSTPTPGLSTPSTS